jgi:4-amino-4-deoxy-L-arabinose transferase-like glycosyltransferase
VTLLKTEKHFLILLVILTIIIRGGVLIASYQRLSEDTDAYLGIAKQIAAGEGFSSPGSNQPTAFRPPLYPLLLALAILGPGSLGIAILHLILGVATVLLTWRLGLRLNLGSGAKWAACLIAFDPLLVQYSTLPMTESLCAFLAVLALNLMVPLPESKWKLAGLGIVLGLCIVSRPTFLAFGALAILIWIVQERNRGVIKAAPWAAIVGMLLTVSPWMIRNALVIGEPRITTTHGGYTLLLGNNPVFYREVVEAPWGTTWEGESLARWQASLETEIKAADPAVKTEPERDRWMARRARTHISENPGLFLKASGLRFLRFWNVFPPKTALDTIAKTWKQGCQNLGLPAWERASGIVARIASGAIGLFYAAIIGSFAVGLFRLNREEWKTWCPLVLLIACFCAVHLIYWSNTRMRAPVMPAIVLLAVRAWSLSKRQPVSEDARSA